MAIPFQITVDCADAGVMSRFWSTALGYVEEPPPAGYLSWEDFLRANGIPVPPPGSIGAIVDPDDIGPRILFLRVPEAKTVKNRVHLDVRAGRSDDEKLAKIDELKSAGAAEIRRVDEHGSWWMVMRDPEGNEFCVT
ncbi:MAG: VOC family protein [Ilumatobacter sp.]|nr:VOC family protein [Ilumatobacter sp.]